MREEEELTEEWPDGLKKETKSRRMSAERQRETKGANRNTKKRRNHPLVVSAEEQYAGGEYASEENDRKRKRMSVTKPQSHLRHPEYR